MWNWWNVARVEIKMNRTEVHARISFWFAFDPFLTNYIHKLIRQTVYNFMRWSRCFQKGRHLTTQMFVCLLNLMLKWWLCSFSLHTDTFHSRISWAALKKLSRVHLFHYMCLCLLCTDSFTLQTILNSFGAIAIERPVKAQFIYFCMNIIHIFCCYFHHYGREHCDLI